ncbi:TPA: DNA-directed RNA polymerase subunit delta [bacterium]|nr:DNA-directed RNA polymerase subunit delta [bacterium]
MRKDKSLTEIAYELMFKKKGAIEFAKLWEDVRTVAGLTEEEATKRISDFYTQLVLDGRFVTLGGNTWDLRLRHTFDKVHIDMNEIYPEDDDDIEIIEDEDIIKEKDDDEDEDEEEDEEDLIVKDEADISEFVLDDDDDY